MSKLHSNQSVTRVVIKDYDTREILYDKELEIVRDIDNPINEKWIYVRQVTERRNQ